MEYFFFLLSCFLFVIKNIIIIFDCIKKIIIGSSTLSHEFDFIVSDVNALVVFKKRVLFFYNPILHAMAYTI